GLAVLLRRHDLVLATGAIAREQDLVDLATLRRRAGLPGAPLERAHHATLDHALEAFHAERLGAQDGHALVAPGARSADQLVVRGTEPLAVQVVDRAESVEDHAAGGDPSLGGDGEDLVDPG